MREYTAENVQFVTRPGTVTAVWIGDESLAKDPAKALSTHWASDTVEVIADAVRHYRSEGSEFSGWVVRSGLDYSDSIPNKKLMMEELRRAVASRMPGEKSWK